MRIVLLTFLTSFAFTHAAQAVEFHPLESMTIGSAVPGVVFQFDNLTIPVGVTVSLPAVGAGAAIPTAQFNIVGDALIEGSLLAPGWNLSLNFAGGFISGPQSRIESHTLNLVSLGQSNLKIGGAIVLAGASLDLSKPSTTSGAIDGGHGSGGVTLQAGAPIAIISPSSPAVAVGAGGTLNLLAPLSPSPLFLVTSGSGQGSELLVTSAPIPEPESYALMLAGLGLVGFVARGKR